MTMTRCTCTPDAKSPCKVYVTQSRIYLDFLFYQAHRERCHPHGNICVDDCTVPVELPERHSAGHPRRRCFAAHCLRMYQTMPWSDFAMSNDVLRQWNNETRSLYREKVLRNCALFIVSKKSDIINMYLVLCTLLLYLPGSHIDRFDIYLTLV